MRFGDKFNAERRDIPLDTGFGGNKKTESLFFIAEEILEKQMVSSATHVG